MNKRILLTLLGVGLLALLPLASSAVTVTLTPDSIEPGDQVQIAITGLPDGSRVSIGISGDFTVVPGNVFSFEVEDLNFPFMFDSGMISAEQQGALTNTIEVRRGDTTVRQTGESANGRFSKSFAFNITSGIVDYIRLSGTAATPAIATDLLISGTKTGPENGEITFNIDGVENGEVTVRITVDNTEALRRTILVESAQTPIPTSTDTPAPTGTIPQDETDGESDSGGRGGSSSSTTTVPVTAVVTTIVSESLPPMTSVTPTRTAVQTVAATIIATPDKTAPPPTTTRAGIGMLFPSAAGLAVILFLAGRRR